MQWSSTDLGGGLIRCAVHAAYRSWAELLAAWPHEGEGARLRVRVRT